MKLKYVFISLLIIISTSCSILKKSAVSEKDAQKKELEFIYLFDAANKNRLNGNFEKASEQYITAMEINPESAASEFYLASIFIAKKDYETASSYAVRAVELQPDNFWYNLEKADLLNKTGKQKAALIIYESLVKKTEYKELLYEKLIHIYTENKDINNLISVYEQKQKLTGYSPETAEKLFNLYLKVKNYNKAEQTVSQLSRKYPAEIRYQGMAAEYYYSVNQIVNAEKIYNKLLNEYPDNTDVNLSYALFCRKTGNHDEYFKTTKKLIPSDLEFIKKYNLLVSGRYRNFPKNEYFELLNELYKNNTDEIMANTLLAEYYIDENNKEKAIPYIRRTVELNPSDFNMLIMLFSLTYDIKDFNNLSKDTEKYLTYFPNQPKIYLYKGIAEYKLKNYQEAEKYLKSGKNLIIQNPNLLDQFNLYLTLIYKKTKQFDKALTLAEIILKHKNKEIKIYELYGDLLFAVNKKQKALSYWKQAQINGNNTKKLQNKIDNFQNITIDDVLK